MVREERHPCFSFHAKYKYARVHLPIAKGCNIQCNYCDRKFDCVNESRPGVTSKLLTPFQSVEYMKRITKVDGGRISVVGIAGPGDPFADPDNTLEALRMVKESFPDLLFCLSTNGLNIHPYVEEIKKLGVSHVTITVNGIIPSVLGEIYSWVRFDKKVYRGVKAGLVLLEQQLKAIEAIKKAGLFLKINTVILPGINDWHIPDVAKKMAEMNVDIINCIPVYPNGNEFFKEVSTPDGELVSKIRSEVKTYLPQMTHCARCRSDAAGLLGNDFKEVPDLLAECSTLTPNGDLKDKPYVAVASQEGLLVNRHLGETDHLIIYEKDGDGFKIVEKRDTPPSGMGDTRWNILADKLEDCRALLVSGVGGNPLKVLSDKGIQVIEMGGLIEEGLDAVYEGKKIKSVKKRDSFKCGSSCGGDAMGCC